MPLIDDIEFYGSRVAAGDLPREQAAQLLAEASEGLLGVRGALQAIDTWEGVRDRMRALHGEVVDAMRAAQNGRPVPDHVQASRRARQKARLLRQLRRRGAGS